MTAVNFCLQNQLSSGRRWGHIFQAPHIDIFTSLWQNL